MHRKQIILASGSPRRKLLLSEAGYSFKVHPSNVNEDLEEKDPHRFTQILSQRKAKELYKKFPDSLIIAADTMVYMENKLYGKPSDFNQAFDMIRDFSGKTHKIITGITILFKDTQITESDESVIKLKKLSEIQIRDFINNTNPYDKAGAYSVEELPNEFIKEIKGEVSTILGLPMHIVKKHLDNLT